MKGRTFWAATSSWGYRVQASMTLLQLCKMELESEIGGRSSEFGNLVELHHSRGTAGGRAPRRSRPSLARCEPRIVKC